MIGNTYTCTLTEDGKVSLRSLKASVVGEAEMQIEVTVIVLSINF